MNIEKIGIGTKLDFEEGTFLVESINGGKLVYGTMYIVDYDENYDVLFEREEKWQLTFRDIEAHLYAYDGHNHKVRWEGARS